MNATPCYCGVMRLPRPDAIGARNDIGRYVIARSGSDEAILVGREVIKGLPRGVYPELCKILRYAQNDRRRRTRNDIRKKAGNDNSFRHCEERERRSNLGGKDEAVNDNKNMGGAKWSIKTSKYC